MSYLTRMHLHPRRRGTARLLAQPRSLHAAIMSSFPPGTAGSGGDGSGRVLWRVDRGGEIISLYIVSPVIPSLEHIQEQAGWPDHKTWETVNYDGFLSELAEGDLYNFRLTANPVHQITLPNGTSKKVAHVTAQQQTQWLVDRAEKNGFALCLHAPEEDMISVHGSAERSPIVTVSNRSTLGFQHDKGRVTLGSARFDGVLEVTDPDALRRALTSGIGRGKAYGQGLLTLAPIE